VVPFLKVANDTAVAVNQGGKRKGAVCAYLETWHLDVEEFLELRKNTGDDRRRTHDMNTAHWVPDLFMQRVEADAEWTLFSPDDAGHLHDLYGQAFREAYEALEARARAARCAITRWSPPSSCGAACCPCCSRPAIPGSPSRIPANLRSPQQHVGVVHSSNLCTEITLNTSDDEIAVCNLGSVNLAAHVRAEKGIDHERLRRTVRTAMRMLDNVIDINYYSVPQARRSNLRHRPVGLGVMGFQDALYRSACLRQRRGRGFRRRKPGGDQLLRHRGIGGPGQGARQLSSFEGSLWSQGILPIDSIRFVAEARDGDCTMDTGSRWTGTACARRCVAACATPTAWPSRRPPPSPTSSASPRASSPTFRTCTSNRTSPASSPW
jgi:ribonucleoside-diphosphate reductase alpha chain